MAAEGRRAKRRKAPRRRPPPPPPYLLQETDDDVLLVISALPGETAPPRRRPRKGRGVRRPRAAPGSQPRRGQREASPPRPPGTGSASCSWGETLPLELLVRIFRHGLALEGSVRFLGRVAQVCRLWYAAAANPLLWQEVSIGSCWGAPPGQKRAPPALEKRVLGTVEWLAANRFSRLRDFTLSHWKSHVPFVLKAIGDSCPLLASLKLSYCSGVTAEALRTLAACCPWLESLNLQNSQVDSAAIVSFLDVAGSRTRHLWLTYIARMNAVFAALLSGVCPELQLLEINTEIKQSAQHFQFPIEQLQAACPQLRVLRLLNVTCSPKPLPRSAPGAPGFPKLDELCLATAAFSFVDDGMLTRILCASHQLRVLDLRGCFRVTPKGLESLPCPDVEQLYLGLYGGGSHLQLPLKGSPLVAWKWRHSLRELDLTGQGFVESDLEQALAAFTRGEGPGREPLLRSLNLTGTKVTLPTVSAVIASCPALAYLNLTSCRHLPRGMKKAYRGESEVRQCLHQLLSSSEGGGADP